MRGWDSCLFKLSYTLCKTVYTERGWVEVENKKQHIINPYIYEFLLAYYIIIYATCKEKGSNISKLIMKMKEIIRITFQKNVCTLILLLKLTK